jgi:hypothetical protein
MTRLLLMLCIPILVVFSCKNKKVVSRTGADPVESSDFLNFFSAAELPFTIADTTLVKKFPDSSLIAFKVFAQFVPDSVFKKDFGNNKPKIYPLGKAKEKGKETYLFIKAVSGTKRAAYIITFDQHNKYLNTLPIVRKGFDNTWSFAYGSLDKKFQINTYREKKSGSDISFKRNVYIYNSSANDFTLIFTEPNEEVAENIVNPIDTFAQKNKYTGDYESNKKNFISFRDGKTPSDIIFFVHFEKNKGECIGELKGTARFVSAKKAVYNQSGNPCMLEFNFTPTAVVMKEIEGCGSYRDIKCFFEGTFPKKKKKPTKNTK